MNVYLSSFVAVTVLTHLSLLALKLFVSEEFSLRRVWAATDRLYSLLAGVISLVVVAFVTDGVSSNKFKTTVIAAVVFFVLGAVLRKKRGVLESEQAVSFKERLYAFSQSWAGSVVYGSVFGFIVTVSEWRDNTRFLTDVPSKGESRIYMYIFGGMILASLAAFVLLRRGRLNKSPTAASLRSAVNYTWFVPAIAGLAVALIQNQTRNVTLANRYLTIAVFVWIVIFELWNLVNLMPGAYRMLMEEKIALNSKPRHPKRKKRKRRK